MTVWIKGYHDLLMRITFKTFLLLIPNLVTVQTLLELVHGHSVSRQENHGGIHTWLD
jgi:hypothetical protein